MDVASRRDPPQSKGDLPRQSTLEAINTRRLMRRFLSSIGTTLAAVLWGMVVTGGIGGAPGFAQPPAVGCDGTNALTRARYTIEAINFRALDETGIDSTGSDEIVARFTVEDQQMFTGEYGSVDRGETHPFRARQRCIFPAVDPDGARDGTWWCQAGGRPGPVTFTITLYEHDGGLRHFLTNPLQFCLEGGSDLMTRCDTSTLESTVIGSYRLTYSEAELAVAMPRVGMYSTKTILIDRCSAPVTIRNEICGYSPLMPNYSAYRVSIRITRKPDGTIEPPVIN
jgi:hypothetical protein